MKKGELEPDDDTGRWPWPVKVFTLGRFGLMKEGSPVHFSKKALQKPLAMLRVLIALGGRNVAEEEIVDILWQDLDGHSAHKALAITLHRLRNLLGNSCVLLFRDKRITLNPCYCWVDVWAFERLLHKADAAIGEDKKENAIDLIEKAVAMCHGPFMGQDATAVCFEPARVRLKSKLVRYTALLVDLYEEKGEFDQAIDLLRRGIEADPLAEDLYRHLMLCYQKLNRRAEALDVYNDLKRVLTSAHGIVPSSGTEAVYRSIITG
ncbi:MAG: bacterial transcriptional activator domain-containing protein [Chloroflexota bacterium]